MLLQENELLPKERAEYFMTRATRRNKRMRQKIARHKLAKLYTETKDKYGVGAWFNERKNRIIKDSIQNASVRTACNRRFRHRLNSGRYDTVANGGAYRKHEEYWWAIL